METRTLSEFIGKIFTSIEIDKNDEKIIFSNDNCEYLMYHEQDCCESVWIEEIIGDINDLINSKIIIAEERTCEKENSYDDSGTYTFYEFRTVNGSVTIRWCGESNGYYSESVDIKDMKKQEYI